jgi:hypothetical protein
MRYYVGTGYLKGIKYAIEENGEILKTLRVEGKEEEMIKMPSSNIELLLGANVLREIGSRQPPLGYKHR